MIPIHPVNPVPLNPVGQSLQINPTSGILLHKVCGSQLSLSQIPMML